MTPEALAEIGRLLYGDRWQSQMARDFGIAVGTINHYAAGRRSLPPKYLPTLRALLNERGREAGEWSERLAGEQAPH